MNVKLAELTLTGASTAFPFALALSKYVTVSSSLEIYLSRGLAYLLVFGQSVILHTWFYDFSKESLIAWSSG